MHICGLIPRNFAELAEAVPIGFECATKNHFYYFSAKTYVVGSEKEPLNETLF